jgi:hypothetical protein
MLVRGRLVTGLIFANNPGMRTSTEIGLQMLLNNLNNAGNKLRQEN